MKKRLQLFFAFCLFAFYVPDFQAKANHEVGSTISYIVLAPGTYLVSLHLYQDCTAPFVESTHAINLKAPGCNFGRQVNLNQVGPVRRGNHYCAALPNVCTSSGRPNYQDITYQGVVIFSASEQACPDWTISVASNDGSRELSANVVGNPGVYNESFLKLAPAINNNSAQIHGMDDPLPVFCVGQPAQYAINATDVDCDSLSYELVSPLIAPNTPVTYKPHNVTPGNILINSNPKPPFSNPTNPQFGFIPNMGTNYSPVFPLHSFTSNWNVGPNNVIRPFFELNPQNGALRFLPITHNPQPSVGLNKYFVIVQINEWRKVNGVVTRVGFIRRDLRFRIEDCGGNRVPQAVLLAPNQNRLDTIFTVQSGSLLNIQFQTADLDSNDSITVATDVTTVLPGAQFSLSNASQPIGTISWLAAPGGCNNIRYFRVRLSDNACPVKGKYDILAGVKVISVAGMKDEVGNATNKVEIYPNPFRDEVTFQFVKPADSKTRILVFNLLGQEIASLQIPENAIQNKITWHPNSDIPAGMYVAKIISPGKSTQSLKFTRQ